jgi:hypothetical protein
MASYMRTKLLIGIAGTVAIVVLLRQGIIMHEQGSCGQYPVFEPPCSELLSLAETEELLRNRQNTVKELMQVNPGVNVSVMPQSRCQDKGIIAIAHPSEKDCDALNRIIRRDLSDVPYKIVNN